MAWAVSCSGVPGGRSPAAVAAWAGGGGGGVAGGAGGGWGGGRDDGAAGESAGVAGVWDTGGLLTTGSQAAPAAARTVHRTVSRMGAPPPRCPASRRLRLLHLLLPRLDHLVRHFRRHLLIHMRL